MQLLITLVEKQINALAPLITQNEIFIDDLNKNYDRKVKSKSIETLKMFFFTKSSLYYNKNYINNLYLHSGNMLLVIYNNLLNKLSPNVLDYVFIAILFILLSGLFYFLCKMPWGDVYCH